MPGLISVLELPLLTKKPSTVDEGFAKYYFFEGTLRVLTDVDHDVVLDRTLQGLSDAECSAVVEEDTVIIAFSKIKACIQAINDSKLLLGETETTAYRGDRGRVAYDHSQEEHQVILSGIGFVKVNGEDLSYDDTEYVIANGLIDLGIGIKLNYDSKGLITGVSDLLASDIPALAYRPDTWEPDLSEYVITTDDRLSDARNANDVYAWAKNVTKPEYTYSEIDGTPTLLSQFENDPGYLTEETDPIFSASPAFGISSASILSWTNKVSFPGFGLTHALSAYGDHNHALTYAAIIHSHIIADVTGLGTALGNKLETSLKGAVNGLAELDSSGFVKNAQLPSYVDDVLDGTWISTTTFNTLLGAVFTPESGKIYIDTTTNKTYRWSGTVYAEVSASLALGVLSDTAYRGDFGNIAYINRITSLTTVGIGVASLSGNVLNIPTYASTDTLATVTGRGNTTATAIYITDTTQSDLYNQGSIKTAGGIGAIKNIYAGGVVYGAGFMATHSSVPYYGFGPLGDKASLNFDISQGKLIFKVGASEVIKFNTAVINVTATMVSTQAIDNSITVTTTGITNNVARMIISSGNGTTSSRFNYSTYRSLETVPQQWDIGMVGDKYFSLQNNGVGTAFYVSYLTNAIVFSSTVKATSFIRTGGIISQFLKADGSVDSNTYALASDFSNVTNNAQWYSGNHPTTFADYGLTTSDIVHISGAETITGNKTFTGDMNVQSFLFNRSYLLTPFYVNSTVKVDNLNADLLDGQHGSYYASAVSGGYLPLSGGTLTGPLIGTTVRMTGSEGFATADFFTYNSDSTGAYGISAITYTGANRKIFKVGFDIGDSGFLVNWVHATTRFNYSFNVGDIIVDGDLAGQSMSMVAPLGIASISGWTWNSDTESVYGTNAIGYLGANRKIFRAGTYEGSNGFTVDWLHTPDRFAYNFNMGDITVDGSITATEATFTGLAGTGDRMVVASSAGVLSTQTIPSGTATSDTYEPTYTATTNITTCSVNKAVYIRVGNIVHVKIDGSINPTATGYCTLTLDVPIYSGTTTTNNSRVGIGNLIQNSNTYISGIVEMFGSTTDVTFGFHSDNTATCIYCVEFDYQL